MRENNQAAGKTWTYAYDDGGNIRSKTEYAYTTGSLGAAVRTIPYGYDDATWSDLLTSIDGQSLTADEIGNLLSDGTWTYTWQHGRQLAGMSKTGTNIAYGYDSDGKRITKIVDGTAYNYHYLGDQLVELTWGGNKLHFTYDSTGPLSVNYNGTEYFYVKNAQGDVTGLVNASGTRVVNYTYDAWGNPLATTGSLAATLGAQNPLRYRGYVYDTETGLYYLQSRYYNPGWGRFINADNRLSTGGDLTGLNLFAYCGNNPVNMSDPDGNWPKWIETAANWVNNKIIQPVKRVFSSLKQRNIVNSSSHNTNRRPYTGEPGSTYTAPNGDWRRYGPDGKPEQDYDHDDHGFPDKHPHDENGGHYHDWSNGKHGDAYAISLEKMFGGIIVVGSLIGMAIIAADDVTGIGVADDALFGPLSGSFSKGIIMIFGG